MKNLKQLITGVVASVMIFAGTETALAMPGVELAAVIDSSGSISNDEFEAQMQGYVSAFKNSSVHDNIEGTIGGVVVKLFFYADSAVASIEAELETAADSNAFADAIDALARPGGIGIHTNIVDAMSLAYDWITGNAYDADRLVMDVSGDGVQNIDIDGYDNDQAGRDLAVRDQRDLADAAGIIVNGLAIDDPDLGFSNACGAGGYYTDNVITNACIQSAGFESGDFEDAVVRKLNVDLVPEPATLALFGIGLAGLSLRKRKLA